MVSAVRRPPERWQQSDLKKGKTGCSGVHLTLPHHPSPPTSPTRAADSDRQAWRSEYCRMATVWESDLTVPVEVSPRVRRAGATGRSTRQPFLLNTAPWRQAWVHPLKKKKKKAHKFPHLSRYCLPIKLTKQGKAGSSCLDFTVKLQPGEVSPMTAITSVMCDRTDHVTEFGLRSLPDESFTRPPIWSHGWNVPTDTLCCWIHFYGSNRLKWLHLTHKKHSAVHARRGRAACRDNGLPSEVMAETARLQRGKHVTLVMNVEAFTACLRWGDGNWAAVICLNWTALSLTGGI